jgi:hypothetical protein
MRTIESAQCWIPVLLVAVVSLDLRAGGVSVPKKLTPETFEAIKARVRLSPADLAWQKVHWRDGFFEGLLEAQAQDKPLFYWIHGGDPRGNC